MDPGRLLLEAANWSTIAACLVLKLPQGAALVAARSARGVSLESLLLELGGYMSYYRYPQLTYVEYPLMILQDIILCLLILSTVVSAASKLAQLRCLWQTKDSEQVSATTWGLATYTCAVLIRFVVMMALNVWVIATILKYRKAKKQD
ncbi:hypothetical protein Chor_006978 [Crotalus horridus]